MSLLDLDRLRAAPLCRDPFDFVVVEDFVHRDGLIPVIEDFPKVRGCGSFPVDMLRSGPAFTRLVGELTAPPLRR
ncbi:MAG: 2OG-Fe(II) oxygenase, partial [Alphaproteobacteria bacterium]|nr:2OG-Fe(II) oxygenase [Alphaproteobacteria bacterium]